MSGLEACCPFLFQGTPGGGLLAGGNAGGFASVFVRGVNLAGPETGSGSPLPTTLAGVSILVEGVPAPILAIAPVGSGSRRTVWMCPRGKCGS